MHVLSHPIQLAEPKETKRSQAAQNREELNMERFWPGVPWRNILHPLSFWSGKAFYFCSPMHKCFLFSWPPWEGMVTSSQCKGNLPGHHMHQSASHSSPAGDHQVLLSEHLAHKGQLIITAGYYFTSSQKDRACSLPIYLVREEPLSPRLSRCG